MAKEGCVVDIADFEDVALIVISAGTRAGGVIGIYEAGIEARRRVVNRVAVGVCRAKREISRGARGLDLQSVVNRVGSLFQARDVGEAVKRTVRIGVIAARHGEINSRLAGHRDAIDHAAVANVGAERLAGSEWILRGGERLKLIYVALGGEMGSF